MRELITNPQLFRALLSLLSGNAHVMGHQSSDHDGKRKRSPSEDNSFHAKKKQMLATPPPNRQQLYSARQTSQSQLGGTGASSGLHDSVNLQVFAATALYTVLQHVDHWPVQLMSLFAEDAFGQRAWVDNDLCRDLVMNLEMSLKPNSLDKTIDASTSLIADEVETHFSSLLARAECSGEQPLPDRVMVSSQRRTPSTKEMRTQAKPVEAMDDSSSSSGEEEILESNSMEVDSIAPHQRDLSSIDICQKLFQPRSGSKQKIRLRYVGHTLDLANEAISDALTERLSSKSKQNSRLVQALPHFLCIPRVRCLSSRHLDRWLQSPALASLAR
jgi:hypothetical protein